MEATTITEEPISSNDQQQQHRHYRGGQGMRKRRKKQSLFLTDFYHFQTKEHRKTNLQELRRKFPEDLAKLKRMKEERQYQPF